MFCDFLQNVAFSQNRQIIIRAFTFKPSNYTYIPLKNNSYINIFPLKTNTFSLSFQLNNRVNCHFRP
ncbi:hypothetical protein Hanom_Chr01g00063471 [Helianthus anomalus]